MNVLYKIRLPVPENTNKFINRNRKNPFAANNTKTKLKNKIKKIIGKRKLIETPFLLYFDIHTKLTLKSDIDNVTLTKDTIDGLIGNIITDDSLTYMPIPPIVTVSEVHLNQNSFDKKTEEQEPYMDLYIYDLSGFNFESYYNLETGKIINGKKGKEIKINNDNIRTYFATKLKGVLDEI